MKKNRNARKKLNDLYLYLDINSDFFYRNPPSESMKKRYEEIKEKYDEEFKYRKFREYEWNEYYGLFKLKNGRVGIDPKRMIKKNLISEEMYKIMSRRTTTYFHPRYKDYSDYQVNNFVSEIDDIRENFIKTYKPLIDKSVEDIKQMKPASVGDYDKFQMGISGPGAAQAWANWVNMRNARETNYKKFELYNSLYAQFFHSMTSRIEAVTVAVFSEIAPNIKKWSRDKLYDYSNENNISSRDLPSFKYHNKLYSIWNFIKHNNISTYEKLKRDYPHVLVDVEFQSGDLAIHYLKLDEKLILDLLNGVRKFFIEWCKLNCNEDYSEAQWNYDKYFIKFVDDVIEGFRNPLGLEWWDELD